MLAVTRKAKIKDIILEKKSVIVSELAKDFSVTEETIRRDLKTLEDEGFLIRTYGGAFIQDGVQNEVELSLRETAYTDSKQLIAKKCAEIIHNGDSIFLDASTTALFIAKSIREMRLTVLTNSLKVINLLTDSPNIRLISIGGLFNSNNMSFIGRSALSSLESYYVDKTFMSCRSLSQTHGVTDSNEAMSEIRQKLLKRSNKIYVVADYSKFDKTSFISICGFEDIDGVITDKQLDQGWTNFLAENNVIYYPCK
ncbi:DeoR/GlpR family DNA-binding transcription regulator [Anaerocolumna sp.]|uniref:DeoR/GlpR family DNA-binding transcription regulator n=1 Tax=Anaerocolumna sp. TaxID=2041569 RepID=UPI0028AD0833|nr:DeoR/GlpR family DNA-binding transcription regulator [Anaerocolumna sp.]